MADPELTDMLEFDYEKELAEPSFLSQQALSSEQLQRKNSVQARH